MARIRMEGDRPKGLSGGALSGGALEQAVALLVERIPPEWVGLAAGGASSRAAGQAAGASLPAAGAIPSSHPDSPGRRAAVAARTDAAIAELVSPIPSWLERGGCPVEPGRACRGSGRCHQRGF